MQQFLLTEWGITAEVFYDRAPAWFCTATLQQKHDLLERLAMCVRGQAQEPSFADGLQPLADLQHTQELPWLRGGRPFTQVAGVKPSLRPDRPALLVSSTSWTVDEDFGVLLEAGILYDAEVGSDSTDDDDPSSMQFTQHRQNVVIVVSEKELRKHPVNAECI